MIDILIHASSPSKHQIDFQVSPIDHAKENNLSEGSVLHFPDAQSSQGTSVIVTRDLLLSPTQQDLSDVLFLSSPIWIMRLLRDLESSQPFFPLNTTSPNW